MRLISSFVMVACMACGTSGSGTDGGGSDGPSGGDGNPPNDSGGTTDSGLPPTKYTGTVLVSNQSTIKGMHYDVFGVFQLTQMGPSSMSCTTTMDGACVFYDCVNLDAGTLPMPTILNAGTLEVDVGANMIMPTPMANGEYRAQGAMSLFSGGENVRAKATGNPMGAPAFDLSVTAPSRITVTQPTYPPMGPLAISRASAFDVKWSGGMTGKVNVSLSTYPTGGYKSATCSVDASSGGVTIPATSMAKLTTGGGFLGISCLAQTIAVQGDWGFILEADNTAVDPNNSSVTLAQATLQ
jgi:hypothetical protein